MHRACSVHSTTTNPEQKNAHLSLQMLGQNELVLLRGYGAGIQLCGRAGLHYHLPVLAKNEIVLLQIDIAPLQLCGEKLKGCHAHVFCKLRHVAGRRGQTPPAPPPLGRDLATPARPTGCESTKPWTHTSRSRAHTTTTTTTSGARWCCARTSRSFADAQAIPAQCESLKALLYVRCL